MRVCKFFTEVWEKFCFRSFEVARSLIRLSASTPKKIDWCFISSQRFFTRDLDKTEFLIKHPQRNFIHRHLPHRWTKSCWNKLFLVNERWQNIFLSGKVLLQKKNNSPVTCFCMSLWLSNYTWIIFVLSF